MKKILEKTIFLCSLSEDLYAKTSSVVEYYERFVLGNQDSSWDNFGYPRWQSVMALGKPRIGGRGGDRFLTSELVLIYYVPCR